MGDGLIFSPTTFAKLNSVNENRPQTTKS